MSKEFDVEAFKDPLRTHTGIPMESRHAYRLFQSGDTEDYVIRKETPLPEGVFEEKTVQERAVLIAESFKELREKYGISIKVQLIVGKDERNKDSIFTIADRVIAAEDIKAEAEAAYRTLDSLISYYEDKFEYGGTFLEDINLHQYVFGKTKGDSENHLYLIDLDGYLSDSPDMLLEEVESLGRHTEKYEGVKDFTTLYNRAEALTERIRLALNKA